MIRNCKNCAGRIRYSISKKALICDSCSSTFEISHDAATGVAETYECNEYACASCGAKILVNDTEASTFCIYCGSSNVVFERVNSEKAPKRIVPFEVTREVAAQKVREIANRSKWVPNSIKKLKDSQMTPIYVPYYVTKVEYDGSVVSGGKQSTPYQLNGYGRLTVVTDAVSRLDDDTMAALEPFNLEAARDFNPDYLLGFHSDIPNVTPEVALFRAKEKAAKLATALYKNEAAANGYGGLKNDYPRRDTTEIYEEPEIILLPVWFMTIKQEGEVYTILINGQTGHMTGMIPSDGRKVRLVRNLIALPIILFGLIVGVGGAALAIFRTTRLDDAFIFLMTQLLLSAVAAGISYAALWYKKKVLTDAEVRSRDNLLSIFANRRQKGD